ncbi:MAG: PTS sugar transporter subunit IIA [Desulfobacteraceae bacterium]|nr:PTS sugar transporter subunit IIA [Desulfobacteraceae bacterium]MCF8095613.1 PTS sugar transporter subunit IIA [Desulfobacteraceae bacterium]
MELEINEFCSCLELPLSTVERWIRQGRIPVKKIGDRCLFSDTALRKWAQEHNLPYCPPDEQTAKKQAEKPESLSEAVGRGGIYYDLPGKTVEEVLGEAVSAMKDIESESDRQTLYETLVAREQMMSTGIGNGVAIPHPRTPLTQSSIAPQIAVCFLAKPVDFNAVDKKPVYVLFVLVASNSKQHLQLLSRLSYCLRDTTFLNFLSRIPPPETLIKKIIEFESHLNGGE